MALLGWGTVTGDADYGLYALFHSSQARTRTALLQQPEVDALLDEARAPRTRECCARQLYAEAMQLIWDDAAWLFLYSESQLVAIATTSSGFVIHPTERFLALTALD
jgi:ABC-type transport system substrate-binding protein